jgi:hypothetical protein
MHLLHLLGRAIYAMPSLVSGNWPEAGLALFIFLFAEFLVFRIRGRDEMRKRWKENVGIGVVSVIAGWVLLFCYSLIVSVCHDHFDISSRWRLVVNEKNALKASLMQRDSYISLLQNKLAEKPGTITRTISTPPEKKCWLGDYAGMPNSTIKGAVTADAAIMHCNYKIDAPYRVVVEFDRDFIPGAIVIPGNGVTMGRGGEKNGKFYVAQIDSPSLLTEQLVVVTVYGPTDAYPKALRGQITSLQ